MAIIEDRKALLRAIGSVGTSVKNLRVQIQAVIPSIIFHAFEHGDVTLGDRLLDATKGADRQALTAYMETYGPFRLSNGKFKLNAAFRKDNTFDAEFFEGDEAPTWWEFAKEKKALNSIFDLEQQVQGILKRLEKAQSEDGKAVLNAGLAEYLRSAVAKYHGDSVLRVMAQNTAERETREAAQAEMAEA